MDEQLRGIRITNLLDWCKESWEGSFCSVLQTIQEKDKEINFFAWTTQRWREEITWAPLSHSVGLYLVDKEGGCWLTLFRKKECMLQLAIHPCIMLCLSGPLVIHTQTLISVSTFSLVGHARWIWGAPWWKSLNLLRWLIWTQKWGYWASSNMFALLTHIQNVIPLVEMIQQLVLTNHSDWEKSHSKSIMMKPTTHPQKHALLYRNTCHATHMSIKVWRKMHVVLSDF